MRASPRNVRYDDLTKVCGHYFGPPPPRADRMQCSSVNIQNEHGKAKPYQVRQVLAAIDKKEANP